MFDWQIVAKNNCRAIFIDPNRMGFIDVEVSKFVVRVIDLSEKVKSFKCVLSTSTYARLHSVWSNNGRQPVE